MRVRYTPRAENDLKKIFAYVNNFSSDAAFNVIGRIQDRVADLETHPFMGPPTNRPGIRSLVISPYSYKVYYPVGAAKCPSCISVMADALLG